MEKKTLEIGNELLNRIKMLEAKAKKFRNYTDKKSDTWDFHLTYRTSGYSESVLLLPSRKMTPDHHMIPMMSEQSERFIISILDGTFDHITLVIEREIARYEQILKNLSDGECPETLD